MSENSTLSCAELLEQSYDNCIADCAWIQCQTPYTQTALATTITWGGTALGAAVVFFISFAGKRLLTFLDASLGFAAGMMLAAAFFSMLDEALETFETTYIWGSSTKYWAEWRWVPTSIGFGVGCLFVIFGGWVSDKILGKDDTLHDIMDGKNIGKVNQAATVEITGNSDNDQTNYNQASKPRNRRRTNSELSKALSNELQDFTISSQSMRRILALCIAITIHNIPEGIAVGVGFASGDVVTGSAVTVAIALQNFPEGLAVAMPLRAAGESKFMSFFWGQASGLVEPLFGIIAVAVVAAAEALLPYALAFSGGCMLFVVLEDIIPDANERENGSLAARVAAVGFVMMMALEIGFEGILEG